MQTKANINHQKHRRAVHTKWKRKSIRCFLFSPVACDGLKGAAHGPPRRTKHENIINHSAFILNRKRKRAVINRLPARMFLWVLTLIALSTNLGCNGFDDLKIGKLFSTEPDNKERWTINCRHFDAIISPEHQRHANSLADTLKRARGINPKKVSVLTDNTGSSIHYGSYTKVVSKKTGRLVFPQQFIKDIELIRRLSHKKSTPFFGARPEFLETGKTATQDQWDVSKAKGEYTLQIAVFYNTPTFDKRKEVAEQYAKILREEGYNAYYRHEIVKSHVFVGHFNETDIVKMPDGTMRYGPKVEEFIAKNPEEFKYLHENGYLLKTRGADGKMHPPMSYLVKVPRDRQYERINYY